MTIQAIVTGQQQITANVGETKVDVSVSGGIGPTGQTGPAGTTSWTGIVDKPSSFTPSLHAASHAVGGVDYVAPAAIGAATQAAAESLQLQVDGKAAASHTHPASAITSGTINSGRLPTATVSAAGAIIVGSGISISSGVASVSWGSSSTTSCRGDDSRLSNAREWTAATVTQAEAEAGTATDRKAFTVQRVWQAIAAWWAGSAARTKLDGIATGATANQTDSYLLERSHHTGTQTASTISDFTSAVVAAAPPTTDASLLTTGTLADQRLSSNIARTSDVSSAVASLVNSAPSTLDTLKELADALGSDANFSTTVTNAIASKADSSSLASVATSGSYSDLSNKPSIPSSPGDVGAAAASHAHGNITASGTVTTNTPDTNIDDVDVVVRLPDGTLASATDAPSATVHVPVLGVTNGIAVGAGGITFSDNSLQTVAWTGSVDWSNVTNQPTLGTAAAANTGDFAAVSHAHAPAEVTTTTTYTNFLPEGGSLADAYSDIDYALTGRALAADFDQGVKTTDNPQFSTVSASGVTAGNVSAGNSLNVVDPTDLTGPSVTIQPGSITLGPGTTLVFSDSSVQSTAGAALSHAHSASDITSGTIDTARLGSGTADSTTYLRGDQTWATVTSGSTSASDLTSGTLADARLTAKAQAAIDLYLWSAFR